MPSPRGVGVMAVTSMYFPSGRSFKRSMILMKSSLHSLPMGRISSFRKPNFSCHSTGWACSFRLLPRFASPSIASRHTAFLSSRGRFVSTGNRIASTLHPLAGFRPRREGPRAAIPANAGIQDPPRNLDSRVRGDDFQLSIVFETTPEADSEVSIQAPPIPENFSGSIQNTGSFSTAGGERGCALDNCRKRKRLD